ncbi:MAG: glucose-1-phosphate thymidylyltransferase [Elusimicrobiota bacterium]
MKGLILSGGKGTRLRPITHTNAKQLIPIANKPILFYGIETLRDAGIIDIGIVVGDTAKEIQAAVGDGSKFGVHVTYIPQEAPLGLAHAVLISEKFIGDNKFVMYLGDNLIKEGIHGLVKKFVSVPPSGAQILLAHVPNPRQFGVAKLEGEKVVELIEKPEIPPSDLALVGVYMFTPKIFEAVKNIVPSKRNELEITDAIQYLIDHKFDVIPHIISGWWKDTGKLDDLLEANCLILNSVTSDIKGEVSGDTKITGNVVIEKGAKVLGSTLCGPLVIGTGSVIKNSYIGPDTSIYFSVNIESSEIERSIVLENSKIVNIHKLVDSLIGQNVELIKQMNASSNYRIMVGDSSKMELV